MTWKRGIIASFFFLIGIWANGQELIANGDFEDHGRCQKSRLDIALPSPWLHNGTPDYFMEGCADYSPENNPFGAIQPESGSSFAGLRMDLDHDINKPLERLIAPLKNPLKAGKVYHLSFYVALAPVSVYSLNEISIWLPRELKDSAQPSFNALVIIHAPDTLKAGKWVNINTYFRARGGEKYMVLGNFLDSTYFIADKRYFEIGSDAAAQQHDKCYLFVDSVSMTSADISEMADTSPAGLVFSTTTVYFASGKSALDSKASSLLNNLVADAHKMDAYRIEITGYTDSSGKEKNNLLLSKQRALAVKNYLVHAGLNRKYIKSGGLSSSSPVAPNNTPQGRSQNRRVVVVLKKKFPFPVLSSY